MIFSVNGFVHYTYNPNPQNSETWPFDAHQYLLLNIAIESSFTETKMEVDYVRVYEASSELSSQTGTTPNTFYLNGNYPNPFNPITTLSYELPEQAHVILTVYDLVGREITRLVNTTQGAGVKSIHWDATNNIGQTVSAGIYLYTIQAGEFRQTRKMVLLK
jgi:hypothetical protein